jgi:hypothetical protein
MFNKLKSWKIGLGGMSALGLFCFTLYDNRKRIYYGYRWLQFWGIVKGVGLLKICGLWGNKNVIEKPTAEEVFNKKHKDKFMGAISSISGDLARLNANMLDIYYKKEELTNIIAEDRNNKYEAMWRARTIIINTPFGNIGMYYNLYNRGFAYYSDVKDIPYMVLNSVAMHYVLTYFCLDFYVDNMVVTDWRSEFWEIWDKPVVEEKTVVSKPFIKRLTDEKSEKGVSAEKRIIAKLKNYRLDFGKDDKGDPNIIYNKNRFIYSGKIIDIMAFKMKKVQKSQKVVKPKKLSFEEYRRMVTASNDTILEF